MRAANTSLANHVWVVLGWQADAVREGVGLGRHTFVRAPDFREGMSGALRRGIAAVPTDDRGAVIVLGDQPFVSADLLNRFISTACETGALIVSCRVGGHQSTPTYFSRRLFEDLLQVHGDEGGRRIVAKLGDHVQFLDVDEHHVLDIDDSESYRLACRLWPHHE